MGARVGAEVGEDEVGLSVGEVEGLVVGLTEGEADGWTVVGFGDGASVMDLVGAFDGLIVGLSIGEVEGLAVGFTEDEADGWTVVGLGDGASVIDLVGGFDGLKVGCSVDGFAVGAFDGVAVSFFSTSKNALDTGPKYPSLSSACAYKVIGPDFGEITSSSNICSSELTSTNCISQAMSPSL